MSLTLNQEQRMLRDSAFAFVGENAPVAHLRALRDSHDATGFSAALWRRFGELGFSATLVPEAHGGLALGAVEAGAIAEALGHTLAPSPFLSTAVLAARLLARTGTAAQQAQWLPRIAAADAVLALAVDEAARHDPRRIETTARADGSGFVLDGHKTFVVDGHVAARLIVAARLADGTAGFFLLDPGARGVGVERTAMVDAHNAARVRLNAVQVPADARMDGATDAGAALAEVLDLGRTVVAAELLGIADEVFARTLAYLKERRQFDRLIGEFQALQHRMAQLYCEIELSRALLLRAQQAFDADAAAAASLVAAAKAHACATADLAVREGVQLHGGMGMTDAFDFGLFMKRARTLQELFGDAHCHAARFAAMNGY
jgi:acyl-CoA dehydrogenase